ncbi:hypothetical protein ACFV6B_40960 [Streptomyces microflavus]|uniref:hypothetical protein n=1 Tax=Streptomyces microflavus TaxID=1919 RepID=UPI003668A073
MFRVPARPNQETTADTNSEIRKSSPDQPQQSTTAKRLDLPAATALVMENIVGGGIFMLSASAASFGTVSIVVLFFVSLGAITLALLFGRLATRSPSTGGP